MAKKKLFVPELDKSKYDAIQETFCESQLDCDGMKCSDCIYHKSNLKPFIWYFNLDDTGTEVNVDV